MAPSRGVRDAFRVWITLDVRWGDMDAYRHVNNAAYFTYCESARIRYFDVLDFERLREGESHGPAVVTATCNFHRQVHYPATLDVGVRTVKLGRTSFTLDYAVLRREDDELVADGSSVVVWVDYDEGKSIPVPDRLKARIREIDTELRTPEG